MREVTMIKSWEGQRQADWEAFITTCSKDVQDGIIREALRHAFFYGWTNARNREVEGILL